MKYLVSLTLLAAACAIDLKNLREMNDWGPLATMSSIDIVAETKPNVYRLDLDHEILQMSLEAGSDPKLEFLGMEVEFKEPSVLEALCDLGHTQFLSLDADAWCKSLVSPEVAQGEKQWLALASAIEPESTSNTVALTDLLAQLASGSSISKDVHITPIKGLQTAALSGLTLLGNSMVDVPSAACARVFSERNQRGWTFAFGSNEKAVSGLECHQFAASTIHYARYVDAAEREL